MNATKKEQRQKRIEEHGRQLLAIFKKATDRDPVSLCKRLRRIEAKGAAFALRLCNGPAFDNELEQELAHDAILDAADKLLQFRKSGIPVFLNQDPRGYALKIREKYVVENDLRIHRDWGGYGIIAPEIA